METSDRASSVLKQHFDQHRTELSRSELAVAEYLVGLPIDVLIFKSAEEIAADAGTSDATVIRTARRLGFSGLPELKRICSRTMARTIPTSDRLEQRFRGTGSDLPKVAHQMFATAREVLSSTEEQLDEEAFAAAVSLLESADTVWCLGMGTAEVEARHCSIALSRTGLRTRCSGASGFTLANELLDLRKDDAVILFNAVHETAEFSLVTSQMAELGCKLVLVCGVQLGELYRNKVDALLTCVGSPSKLASWSLGAIVIGDLLAYGVAVKNQPRAVATKRRLAGLRSKVLSPK
ncbi:MurR/RpiR family transcriptional regulator [Rhizobium sp. BG4]|jgi:DNA-binding MurR/RpiR family transcriptional regulator|uniref:MurR/RpiR family transcriptional regulator n=1 Tax=Rhizobium sp. BG4 TaxID=2613770 RepID=UPI000DD6928E|nr:MurR/RpiR family transcriptional regulator [Rhizobium sp. BG4]QRM44047.1 MurR/RpiR family transcriptional regulator [Rhizobium sp. BG4]